MLRTVKIDREYFQEEYIILDALVHEESFFDDSDELITSYRTEYTIVLKKLHHAKAVIHVYEKKLQQPENVLVRFTNTRGKIENLTLLCFIENGDLKIGGYASDVIIK